MRSKHDSYLLKRCLTLEKVYFEVILILKFSIKCVVNMIQKLLVTNYIDEFLQKLLT